MKNETLIKFLMDWKGCTRDQATRYIELRNLGYSHGDSLESSTGKLTDDFSPGIWNVTVEESHRSSENLS